MKSKMIIVNGTPKTVLVEDDIMLSEVLRENLRLTGTKIGCRPGPVRRL